MLIDQVRRLAALAEAAEAENGSRESSVYTGELAEAVKAAEREFDFPLMGLDLTGTNASPVARQVLAWALSFIREYEELHHDLKLAGHEKALAPLLERRSVSPKRLCAPGPNAEQIDFILLAALRAPDHGGLHPWRVVEFRPEQRAALAEKFEQEKRRRDPLASDKDLRLAREHAMRAPVLLAFVVSPRARNKVHAREQWLAAGAALCNLLNAAHQLGFGAIMLSGDRCFDSVLSDQLGVEADEFLAGFISMGSIVEAPPPKAHAIPEQVWSCWRPADESAGAGQIQKQVHASRK